MADWDADSPRLRANLKRVLADIHDHALRREPLTLDAPRRWYRTMMKGLTLPNPALVGIFRGEPGLEAQAVFVGLRKGVKARAVTAELHRFEKRLQAAVKAMDLQLPAAQVNDVDGMAAVLDLSAWVHAEWVRIHPSKLR